VRLGPKKVIAVGLILFLTVGLSVMSNLVRAQTSVHVSFLTYTNIDYGFTIKYPSNWSVDDKNISSLGVRFKSPDNSGSVLIGIRNATMTETKMSLGNLSKEILMHPPTSGFKFIELNTDSYFLSGHHGIKTVGIGSVGIKTVKINSLETILNEKLYQVDYLSPPDVYYNNLVIVQEMFDSFQIIQKQ
jgi:hypothetical protein